MRIVSRREWGAKYEPTTKASLPASELWLHHTVTARPIVADEVKAMRQLEEIGHQRFGGTVSYTFAVMPSGAVYEGHGVAYRGTHTKGHNSVARAIVLVGDYSTQPPTRAQIQAVGELIAHGRKQSWWTRASLNGGHRDLASTACPGNEAYKAIPAMNRAAAAALEDPKPQPKPEPIEELDMPVRPFKSDNPAEKRGVHYIDRVGVVRHVKNPTHLRYLREAKVLTAEEPRKIPAADYDALLEKETP